MIERLLILILAAGVAALVWLVWQRVLMRRAAGFAPADPLLAGLQPGTPAILYFTTPLCAPCKTVQRPALAQLRDELDGGVQIIEVDASADVDAARRWGVMSVPTTFILDDRGTPRAINHGVARLDKLRHQVQRL